MARARLRLWRQGFVAAPGRGTARSGSRGDEVALSGDPCFTAPTVVRSLSPIEAAAVFAVGGSVLAVAVPEFVRNLHASRLAEPIDALQRIAAAAVEKAQGAPSVAAAFPASAPLTPPEVPRGVRADDPPGAWDHPTWKALGFSFDHAHAFSFQFESTPGPSESRFRVIAHGDLDGDGVTSTFEVEGRADQDGARVLPGMYVEREIE